MAEGYRVMAKRLGALTTVLLAFCLSLPAPAGAVTDHKGTEFMLTFPGNEFGDEALTLFITGDVQATGTVEIPGLDTPFSASFSVTPGTATAVTIPVSAAVTDSDTVGRKGTE